MKLKCVLNHVFMLAVVASLAIVPEAQAQLGAQIAIGGKFGGDLKQANSVEEMQGLLEYRVDEIKDIAALEDKQVGKLKLTAKVVAKKVFEQRRKRFFVPQGDQQTQSGAEESFSDEDAESQREASKEPLKHSSKPIGVAAALEHKVWQNAIKSILTAAQQATLQEYRDARNQKFREVAVEYRTWELVKRLRLRDDQIEPVSQVVDRIEGADLAKDIGKNRGGLIIMARSAKPKKVTPEDLQEILSETQMKVFRAKVQRKSGNLQMLLGGKQKKNKTLAARGATLDPKADRLTVQEITPDSELAQMGVMVGDIFDEINGKPVDTLVQINRILEGDEKLVLSVLRDGKSIQLETQE